MFKNLFKNFNVNNICRSVGNVIIVDEEAEVAGVTEPHEDVESVDASHDPPLTPMSSSSSASASSKGLSV